MTLNLDTRVVRRMRSSHSGIATRRYASTAMRVLRLLLPAALLGSCSSPPASTPPGSTPSSAGTLRPLPDPLPSVVARVNDQGIPLAHLRILAEKRIRPGTANGEKRARVYRQALDELIRRELLLQEAIARGVRADERVVENAYDGRRATMADENAWRQALARDAMTPESLKAEIRVQLTVQSLLAQVTAPIAVKSVPEHETHAFYERNLTLFDTGELREVSHILIRVPSQADAARKLAARQRIEQLRARVAGGEDFSALARAHSEDAAGRESGGRLAPFGKGEMPKPFEKAAFSLAPEQVSDVVETPFGYHVIKLHRALPSRRLNYMEVRDGIRQRLLEERRDQAISLFVESLRSRARIEIYI